MIDQLAIDYAERNIVFVDYTMDWGGIPNPVLYRYEVIERTEPGWGGLTWAMIDSGQRYSRGAETHDEAVENTLQWWNTASLRKRLLI